eukprot:CAMPEP_0115199220 /NCGR_PEP_ID=MMETSP0270-20121206/16504_1 /TAXON_ID=71861 /ORGANISM="Scrippsiella trochoidea, Strain CCMP3099" /LENGTH=51 /DNA_ID=CAMNT_0002612607 /DNA_START=564 /DNA_END=719 /DNA_ORIENTATION=-
MSKMLPKLSRILTGTAPGKRSAELSAPPSPPVGCNKCCSKRSLSCSTGMKS